MIKETKKALRPVLKRIVQKLFPSAFSSCADFEPYHNDIIRNVEKYTMTSPERIFALIEATKYITNKNIEGDIVECGIWRGGSVMAIIKTLQSLNTSNRQLLLYDTFDGMTEPTSIDVSRNGDIASTLLENNKKTKEVHIWAYATLEDVKNNISSLNYPKEKVSFIKGRVEETLPAQVPHSISLLRLDTDWYKSTKHELTHLFPLLSPGGVLIIDDYGEWQGAKKAVDEYLEENKIKILLNRIDHTGRIGIKL